MVPHFSAEDAPLLRKWLVMCATNAEFVSEYNRLCGTGITFHIAPRLPIERLIDDAVGHMPAPQNEAGELDTFLRFCVDCYLRLPQPA